MLRGDLRMRPGLGIESDDQYCEFKQSSDLAGSCAQPMASLEYAGRGAMEGPRKPRGWGRDQSIIWSLELDRDPRRIRVF